MTETYEARKSALAEGRYTHSMIVRANRSGVNFVPGKVLLTAEHAVEVGQVVDLGHGPVLVISAGLGSIGAPMFKTMDADFSIRPRLCSNHPEVAGR